MVQGSFGEIWGVGVTNGDISLYPLKGHDDHEVMVCSNERRMLLLNTADLAYLGSFNCFYIRYYVQSYHSFFTSLFAMYLPPNTRSYSLKEKSIPEVRKQYLKFGFN